MWQDALVTIVALGAVGALTWRWYAARKKPAAPHCANCEGAEPVAKNRRPAL